MNVSVNVAVSGINATDNPGPGIPVAKSLKQAGMDVNTIGLSYNLGDPGHFLDHYVDRSYILPYPTHGWDGIKDRLIKIKEGFGLDVVIPCLDAELPLYIKYSDELEAAGIRTFLPDEELFELRNKDRLDKVAERIGISHPKTHKIYSYEEMMQVLDECQMPMMIKGPYYKAYKINHRAEAYHYFYSLSQEWGFPLLLQEVVSGEELNVVGVGDGNGELLGVVAAKKLTTTDIGKIWTGVTICHDALLEATRRFVSEYKWKGPFELECIVNGDEINLIEINPRFPAWVYFATGIGVNLPEALVKAAMGLPVEPSQEYSDGKMFVRYTDEVICDMDKFAKLAANGGSHV